MTGVSNINTMCSSPYLFVLFTVLGIPQAVAMELTGRLSMLGMTADAEAGDWGYSGDDSDMLTADQQSLRLMIEEGESDYEWAAHLRTVRHHSHGPSVAGTHSSELFRYQELGDNLISDSDANSTTTVRYEFDRLYYRHHLDDFTLAAGRQAIDWGSGRFWQPLNIFGSFAPTDLDTDYKPGIDVLTVDYFPSPFSSLTAVYAFSPHDQDSIKDSAAIHYRRQVGELSELAMVGGSIVGNRAIGASFESSWMDVGWRLEGVHYNLEESDNDLLFWIAGIEYQFDDATLLHAEYYHNSRGETTEAGLLGTFSDGLVTLGLQQHLSRQLIGIGLARDLTPLLKGSYLLLGSWLDDESGAVATSLLHQISLTYSVSNESDLLMSLQLPSGKGMMLTDEPQSEFGHLPMSFTLRWRFYY